MTVPNPWVWRHNGTIQCENAPQQPIEEARAQLETVIGASNVVAGEERSIPMPQLCGLPTGEVNAFQVTPWGFWLLFHGPIGPIGFSPWVDEEWAKERSGEVPFPFGSLEGRSKVDGESIGPVTGGPGRCGDPVLIAELYGRPCRCYTVGDPLTQDYVQERFNVGLNKQGRISEIWFG